VLNKRFAGGCTHSQKSDTHLRWLSITHVPQVDAFGWESCLELYYENQDFAQNPGIWEAWIDSQRRESVKSTQPSRRRRYDSLMEARYVWRRSISIRVEVEHGYAKCLGLTPSPAKIPASCARIVRQTQNLLPTYAIACTVRRCCL
jgi:hypothetical protein